MLLNLASLTTADTFAAGPAKIAVPVESEAETTATDASDASDSETACSSSVATSADEGVSRLLQVRRAFRPPPGLEDFSDSDVGDRPCLADRGGHFMEPYKPRTLAIAPRRLRADTDTRIGRVGRGPRLSLKQQYTNMPFGGMPLETIPGSPSKASLLASTIPLADVAEQAPSKHGVPLKEAIAEMNAPACLQPCSPKKLARLATLAKAKHKGIPLKVGLASGLPKPKKGSLDLSMPVKKAPVFAECVPNSSVAMQRMDPGEPISKRETDFLFQEPPRVVAAFRDELAQRRAAQLAASAAAAAAAAVASRSLAAQKLAPR